MRKLEKMAHEFIDQQWEWDQESEVDNILNAFMVGVIKGIGLSMDECTIYNHDTETESYVYRQELRRLLEDLEKE